MECSRCGDPNVPVYTEKDDVDEEFFGTYISEMYIPFFMGNKQSPHDTSNLFRIMVRFPKEKPLCKKCRKFLVIRSFENYEEGK